MKLGVKRNAVVVLAIDYTSTHCNPKAWVSSRNCGNTMDVIRRRHGKRGMLMLSLDSEIASAVVMEYEKDPMGFSSSVHENIEELGVEEYTWHICHPRY